MKTYISYVIQDEERHKHLSEIIETPEIFYNSTTEPPVLDVIEWADVKKKELKPHQEIVIVGMFKIS